MPRLVFAGTIKYQHFHNSYKFEHDASEGPSQALAALVSIAVAIATQGTGAGLLGLAEKSIGSAMASAGFSSLCAQTAVALLSNQLDPALAMKSVLSRNGVKAIATAALGAGLLEQLSLSLNLPGVTELQGFKDHLCYNLARASVNAALNVVINHTSTNEALQSAVLDATAGTLAGVLCNKLGILYKGGDKQYLDGLSHKCLHAIVGGISGAIVNGTRGIAAGALGAMVAESVAEILEPELPDLRRLVAKREAAIGRSLTTKEYQHLTQIANSSYLKQSNKVGNIAQFCAGVAALLSNQDVTIATTTAASAITHNFGRSANHKLEDNAAKVHAEDQQDMVEGDEATSEGLQEAAKQERQDRQLMARLEALELTGNITRFDDLNSSPNTTTSNMGTSRAVVAINIQHPGLVRKIAGQLGREANAFLAQNKTAAKIVQIADVVGKVSIDATVYGAARLCGYDHDQAMKRVHNFEVGSAEFAQIIVQKYNFTSNELAGFAVMASIAGGSTLVRPALRFSGKGLQVGRRAIGYVAENAFTGPPVGSWSAQLGYVGTKPKLGIKGIVASGERKAVSSPKLRVTGQAQAASSSHKASSANPKLRPAISKKLSALEGAQQAAVKTEQLVDGRIRYYEIERPSTKPGPTRGSSYVTEYNPETGQVRSWIESYNHDGSVNRVHPKMLDGQDLIGQHYPPTQAELNAWIQKPRGPK